MELKMRKESCIYIDENAPFKEQLIQKYRVQLQWKWNHIGKNISS
jgi:hypothetical protein